MTRALPILAVLLWLTACNQPADRPERVRVELNELRTNHARSVAKAADGDLKLLATATRELGADAARSDTVAGIRERLTGDRDEIDYLLAVYDNPRSPADHELGDRALVDDLRRLRGDVDHALAAAPPPAAQPAPAKPTRKKKK